jgi:hypothetical protein
MVIIDTVHITYDNLFKEEACYRMSSGIGLRTDQIWCMLSSFFNGM